MWVLHLFPTISESFITNYAIMIDIRQCWRWFNGSTGRMRRGLRPTRDWRSSVNSTILRRRMWIDLACQWFIYSVSFYFACPQPLLISLIALSYTYYAWTGLNLYYIGPLLAYLHAPPAGLPFSSSSLPLFDEPIPPCHLFHPLIPLTYRCTIHLSRHFHHICY